MTITLFEVSLHFWRIWPTVWHPRAPPGTAPLHVNEYITAVKAGGTGVAVQVHTQILPGI